MKPRSKTLERRRGAVPHIGYPRFSVPQIEQFLRNLQVKARVYGGGHVGK